MPTKVNPDKGKTNAETILRFWKDNTEVELKDVTLETFDNDTNRLNGLLNDIAVKEQEMTPLRNERDDLALKRNQVCTRAVER